MALGQRREKGDGVASGRRQTGVGAPRDKAGPIDARFAPGTDPGAVACRRPGPVPSRQSAASRQRGQDGEDAACERLRRAGLRVLRRNYRVRGGEVDIVALEGNVLVFVEVRSRAYAGWGGAAASVDARKLARIVLAARHYLAFAGSASAQLACRFDVVAIDGARLRWIRGAFDASGGGWRGCRG